MSREFFQLSTDSFHIFSKDWIKFACPKFINNLVRITQTNINFTLSRINKLGAIVNSDYARSHMRFLWILLLQDI